MKPKILIVEDDENLLSVYSMLLQMNGLEVAVAKNGLEALQTLEEFSPDVILLDLLMPKMDGLTFLEQVDNEVKQRSKIIVYSNLFDGKTHDQVMELGAIEMALKANLSPKDLVALIKRHI